MLNINTKKRDSDLHQLIYFGGATSKFKNLPISGITEFYGYREVRWNADNETKSHLITVEIHEQHPIPGRIWANTYNADIPKWYGWQRINTNNVNSLIVKKFTKDSVTFKPYGYVDIPISTPSGYNYVSCIGCNSSGSVSKIYCQYDCGATYVRCWHPENTTITCSVDVYILYSSM